MLDAALNLLDLVPGGRYQTPSTMPINSVCRLLVIPDDPNILAALHELMTRITSPDAWERSGHWVIHPPDVWEWVEDRVSPEDTAALCAQMWLEYVENARCMPSFCSMIGTILPYASATPPVGCLPCDGGTYLRVHYPRLYAALDLAFIVDADSFVTPDLRGRTLIGAEYPDYVVGSMGGEVEHTLTVDELPSHTHTSPSHTHTTQPHHHAYDPVVVGDLDVEGAGVPQPNAAQLVPLITENTYDETVNVNGAIVSIENTGGGESFSTMPPYYAINYCIVAG